MKLRIDDPSLPLVTIVTPSFNQGEFIGETIESVLRQDYPNIEYIVIDGGSTDSTAQVVRPYLDRLTFISEPDYGQSHAINKGFRLARGEVVTWLNSDDLFLPGAVWKGVSALMEHPEAAVAYGEGYQIDVAGRVKQRFPYTQHFDRWKLIFLSDYIMQQTTFFRKAALDDVGLVREDLHYVMDWEILIRLAKRYEFVHMIDYVGSIREHDDTKTTQGGIERAWEIRDMLREHCGTPFPPGYQLYGFVTYERIFGAAIEAWPKWLEPVRTFARKALRRVLFEIIGHAMKYGQSWYRDNWMAPRARVMLSEGTGTAIIRGQIPTTIPGLTGQRVKVTHRGKVLADEQLGQGKFEIQVNIPESAERCPILTIEGSVRFNLSKLGVSPDKRDLSMRLLEVCWAVPRLLPPLATAAPGPSLASIS